jgi:hypothetical protein
MDVLGELVFGVVVCNMEGVFREGEEDVIVLVVVVDLGVVGGGAFFGLVVESGGITGVMA